jgi:hypothetical protein
MAKPQKKKSPAPAQQKNASKTAPKSAQKSGGQPVQKFLKKIAQKFNPKEAQSPQKKAAPAASRPEPKSAKAAPKNTTEVAQSSARAKTPKVPPKQEQRKAPRPGTSNLGPAQRASSSRSSRSQMCRVIGCSQPATTLGYSRLCYIKYWKQIKAKQQVLEQGTLQRFIRELLEKYPEKIILAIRSDLATDEGYASMIRDLDLYGGIDELEHVSHPNSQGDDDDEAPENDLEDIKKGIEKEDEFF